MRPETAQDQHDELMSKNRTKLRSKRSFEKVMAEVEENKNVVPTYFDPIENAMENFPGLTREKAEEMARAFGF